MSEPDVSFIKERQDSQGMRNLAAKADTLPQYLEKAYLEPYIVVTGESPQSTPRKAPSAMIVVPPERQEAA